MAYYRKNSKVSRDRVAMKKQSMYHTQEFFKELMKWYKILDDSGFDDIERVGRHRNTKFDEYGGILKRRTSEDIRVIKRSQLTRLNNLARFSRTNLDLRLFLPKKTLKSLKKPYLSTYYYKYLDDPDYILPADSPAGCTSHTKLSGRPIKLHKFDRELLKLYSEGVILTKISEILRVKWAKKFSKKYKSMTIISIFFLHHRLKALDEAAKYFPKYEALLDYVEELDWLKRSDVDLATLERYLETGLVDPTYVTVQYD